MRFILILMVLFVGVFATKEHYEDGGVDLEANELTRKLWLEIQKRLKDYDDKSDGLGGSDSASSAQSQCQLNQEVQDGKIIRTKDSLDAGATFIKSPTVDTRGECLSECCDESTCNMAVYKSKGDEHSCYLFDCGTPNICEFTDHPGFEIISLPKRRSENKEQAKHENALEDLVANPETLAPTSLPKSTPEPVDRNKQPAPLFGECQTHKDCAGTWSSCSAGYCLCQDGYHAQDGVCRKDCNRFEYECANEGQPLIYPQCIAIYDKCDGILHCKDGSDERNCDTINPKDESDNPKDTDQSALGHPSTSLSYTVQTPLTKPTPETLTPVDNGNNLEQKNNQPQLADKNNENEQSVSKEEDNNRGEPDTGDEESDTDDRDEEDSQEEDNQNIKGTDTDDANDGDTDSDVNGSPSRPVVEVANGHSAVVDEEEVEVVEENDSPSNRGAIVALALGLAITALLLVFVGCRLRNVKRRLRRGRPLNSNEADYLVNGMYL